MRAQKKHRTLRYKGSWKMVLLWHMEGLLLPWCLS